MPTTTCHACKNILPSQARFCPTCGTLVADTVAEASSNSDRITLLKEYIPQELASKILEAGQKIESERRHVTVMFADVTGFTSLSDEVDPEVVSNLLNDCFRGLVSTIHKYEGTVDKFIGDAIMAIFGAPLAHENDPERAVRCALEMMSDVEHFAALAPFQTDTPISIHIGLHSGMVIAGNVGSDLRLNYSVVGDTVNLASRLAELAPTGEIYLSEATHKQVSDITITDGPNSCVIKGKTKPVNVYLLKGVKTTIENKLKTRSMKQMVGRKSEILIITKCLDQALSKRDVRLFVHGEAGVGKTRLKEELVTYAIQSGMAVLEGFCSSFEKGTPYYLWNTFLKSMMQIGGDTSEDEARSRLHKLWNFLGLDEGEGYVATLLSLRYEEILFDDEASRKQKIYDATTKLLQAYVKKYPTVIVLEDLHWIDKFSQELLEYVLNQRIPIPTLIVGLYRDEYQHAKKIQPHGQVLDLNRLSEEEAVDLMKHRLEVDHIPENVKEAILIRSEGNPFFIQEIIKTLLDRNVIHVSQGKVNVLSDNFEAGIPGTIQGIIMARIDRIQESIKGVLFSASVIGREFSKPLLEHVLEKKSDLDIKLDELQSLEMILEREEAEELQYLFKHYLIQEVAYNTILINKRKELHATIAIAIEELYADRLNEYYEVLAFHFERAEQWEKAAEYYSRSGTKFRQIFSEEESEEFFKRKEAAIQKIFESKSAKISLWATIKGIFPPLIAMLIPILPIFAYITVLGKVQTFDFTELMVVGSIASLLCVWYAISLWFLGVIPFLLGRPKLYDLLEDQVRILFQDGSTYAINFKDIASVRYFDPDVNKKKPFGRKLLDPFSRVASNKKLTFKLWLKDVFFNILPPYTFVFGAERGEIYIRLKHGYRLLRFIIPWFNSPHRSKDIGLLPHAPKQFFEQFRIAIQRWQKNKNSKTPAKAKKLN
jgi:class 3 adenylate cyclase